MRRLASLFGVSLIAGGATVLLMFASSARAGLPSFGGSQIQADETTTTLAGGGSEETTTTTSTTSTTVAGGGSEETTTTTSTSTTSTSTTSTTIGGGGSGTTTTTTAAGGTTTTAAGSCSTPPALSSSRQSIPPGGTTTLSGTCFPKNTDISLTLNSDPVSLGSVKSDGNGTFSITVTIPSNTAEGTHTISAAGGGQSASISVIVSRALSVTGLSWDLAVLGLAMLAAGIILMAGDRIGKQDLIDFA